MWQETFKYGEIYVKIKKYSLKLKDVWNAHLYVLSCRYNHHKYKEHSSENVSIKTVNPLKFCLHSSISADIFI